MPEMEVEQGWNYLARNLKHHPQLTMGARRPNVNVDPDPAVSR